MTDLIAFALFGLALLGAVGVGEVLRAWADWRPESSRRAVHALVGVMVALCPPLFSAPTWIYVLALLFIGVNLVAVPRRFFPGMHAIERPSWGTVTFPLALVAALFTCWTLDSARVYILSAAFLILALADPLASFVGMRLRNPGRYVLDGHEKSIAGSAAFFIAALVLTTGALLLWTDWERAPIIVGALVSAGLATAAEALGGRGWDNLAIVIAVIVPLTVLHHEQEAAGLLLVALLAAAGFGALAWRAGFLAPSGVVAAGLLAFGVVALGGVAWAVPGFAFFFTASVLSRLGRQRKAVAERLAEKSGRRDAGQVYANGGVAGLLLIVYLFWPQPAVYWAFVGSFAAAAADTWGTEIGTYFRWPTRQVFTGREVEPGVSGGVSVPGTLGALAGAAVVFASALPFAEAYLRRAEWPMVALLVIGGGFVAALLDSMFGATVQARYREPSGTLTERSRIAGVDLPLAAGLRWITNDRVNLACTIAGGLIPLVALL